MSSPGFLSDSAAMTRAVSAFDESSSNVKQTMAQLESELQSALAHYAGSQAQAFWGLQQRLQEDMRVAGRELETMSQLVNSSFHNYGSGDSQSSQSFTSLGGQLGGGAISSRLGG